MLPNITFHLLPDYPHFIPVLANWFFTEWGIPETGDTLADAIAKLEGRMNRDKIPIVILALDDENLAGTVQLKVNEVHVFPGQTYWIGNVFVNPDYRNNALGTALVKKAEEMAAGFGIETLYLQTERMDGGLYARLGWQPVKSIIHRGIKVLVMEKHMPLAPR